MIREDISNGAKKPHSFGKPERIIRSYEYKKVHKQGARYKDDLFALSILKNNMTNHRLGLSVGLTKVPLASKRHRIKRIIREFFRLNKMKLKNGPYDIVISIITAPPYKINYSIFEKRLQALLKEANVL